MRNRKKNGWKAAGLLFAMLAAGILFLSGTENANAPEHAENTAIPQAKEVSDDRGKIQPDCVLIQTMLFTRCGHSVTRRIEAPADTSGMNFTQMQEKYDLWEIGDFSPSSVSLEREIDLFCPMHHVLAVNEAGEIVLTSNLYGDGMAVEKTYETSFQKMNEEKRERLMEGIGFDTREEAEAWLNAN